MRWFWSAFGALVLELSSAEIASAETFQHKDGRVSSVYVLVALTGP